ncbi:MAG: hypothetical protein AAFQ80_12155 [Cyanobacteria bacterium J06621_8]
MGKTGFSTFFNKVSFKGKILTITGDKFLTVILLFLFLLGIIWCLTLDLPAFIKGGVVLSVVIIVYALLDVSFSKSVFIYNVRAKHIKLHRKSLRKNFTYQGSSEGFLKVKKVADYGVDSNIPSYFVRLVFDNGQVNIPYQLNRWSMSKAEADKKVQEWRAKLELN